jgi:hypothetical protein
MFTYHTKMRPYGLVSTKRKISKKNPTYLSYFEIPCNRKQKLGFCCLSKQFATFLRISICHLLITFTS